MILMIIFLLFMVSLIATLFHKKKISLVLWAVTIASFLFIGTGLLPGLLLANLQQPFKDTWSNTFGQRNAIVMLGASNLNIPSTSFVKPTLFSYSRIYKAASLYSLCRKSEKECTIVLSGGDPLNTGKPEAIASQEELLTLPINPNDIILESKSINTYKNAEYTSKILKSKSYDQVILVTSGIHMKRALLYFSNFDIHPKPAISDYVHPIISILPQAYNFALTDFALHEYIGIFRIHLYNYMGWNSKN